MKNISFLNESQEHFHTGDGVKAMRAMVDGLGRIRRENSTTSWRAYINSISEHHVLKTALLCPFTRHAASRPFGYPGDATLIDHIYG